MLSVVIPTYNYNVYPLVREMHKQFNKTGVDFEILVYDDASSLNFDLENLLREFPEVRYKYYKENQGKVKMLQNMAKDAKHDGLLVLDADVFPPDRFFAVKTIDTLQKTDAGLYFGGMSVPAKLPDKNKALRWKYGQERESPNLAYRKKHPYTSIVCQNFVIKKDLFNKIIAEVLTVKNFYATDIFFTYLLKKNNISVHHYNNKVVHLGLDDNSDFLEKTKASVDTYYYLYQNKLIDKEHVKLVNFAEKYEPFGLCFATKIVRGITNKIIRKNLLSAQPSLFLLDMYKLIYYCSIRK